MLNAEALLRQYLRAGDTLDESVLRRVLHPDVVAHSPGDLTISGIGHQLATWRAAHEGLQGLTHAIEAVVATDVTAAARVQVGGVHVGTFLGIEPTGTQIRVGQALFVRIEDAEIVEIWEVVDTGSGLRQLGVLGDQPLSPGADPTFP